MASSKAFIFLFALVFALAYLISSEVSAAHETGELFRKALPGNLLYYLFLMINIISHTLIFR